MAQIVKLRRSSVSGQKPTNTNLQLGELALNTTDGKVFMAVSGSGGPSVEELIVTNTVNTGSINVSGSIHLIGKETISGSLYIASSSLPEIRLTNIDHNQSYHITVGNYGYLNLHDGLGNNVAAFGTSSAGLIGDLYVSHSVTASEFTGSFVGNASGLTNVPFAITGSDVDGNSYDKTFTKLQFDDSTGLNVSESAPGTAFISIGSHFRDIFVSGSGMLRATGSDAFEVIGDSGVEVTVSNIDTNYDGYTKELRFSAASLSSSLNDRIDLITGSIDLLNFHSGSVNTHLTHLDNFTSSVVLTSETASMTVLSASYALTAAFALNAGAGGGGGGISDGAYAELNQTTPSTTWTFTHNLGQKYPIFQIFDVNDNVIIPSQITAVDSTTATITFPSAQSGRAIASLGTGPGGMTQQFSSATTWSLSHNLGSDYPIVTVYGNNRKIIFPQEIKSVDENNIEVYFSAPVAGYLNVAKGGHIVSGSVGLSNLNLTGSNIVSGSAQIASYGFATTGSNTFNGSQSINGCLTINNAKICSTGTTISTNTQIFNLSSFDGAFFDYVVKNGSNMRAGSIMSAWNGTNSTFNETTTMDLGNTSAIGFNVSSTGALNATISSGTWLVEVLYRALGNGALGTNYLISTGSTAPDYCSGLFGSDVSVYGNSSDWLTVTRFYTNSSLTTPFNGNSKYYGNSTADYGTTLQIDSNGYVIGNYAC